MRAAALLSGATLSAVVLTACDGATEPPLLVEESPTATAMATAEAQPTPTVASADLEGFRAFAPQVESALQAGDVDFFMDIAEVSTAVCLVQGPLPAPICEQLPTGTSIEGVWTGLWRSEGILATVDEFRASLEEYLASLGEPTLYAIAALDRYVGGIIGGPAVFAVVTSAEDLPAFARVFEFVKVSDEWRLHSMISIPRTGSGGTAFADEWISGDCSECYDRWERWEGTR